MTDRRSAPASPRSGARRSGSARRSNPTRRPPEIPAGPLRVGVDTGGTFTDIAVTWTGGSVSLKVPSTPDDPARAVLEGLRRLGVDRPGALVGHGSTVATNALLERRGGPAALVTTRGFEDLIEIGRQARTRLYDWSAVAPAPLIPRSLRFGVAERTMPRAGRRPLASGETKRLERLGRRLARAGVSSVAVCFLHSYRDGRNEAAAGRALARGGVRVTLSHALSGEYREFERFSTAAANAWLQPVMGAHLRRLEGDLRATLRVLQSSGLTGPAGSVAREPVRAVLSGPAGGVLAAAALARRGRLGPVITLDMGGTSTDVALIEGAVPYIHECRLAGVPLRLRSVHVESVGAGGGSIARLDAGGALRVGPESAGAVPGPACYGRSDLPTVTDAHLVLGRLGADDLLGGALQLDPERSWEALARLGRAMGRSAEEAAEGVLAVADSAMERALRTVSLRRGHDPRRFSLVCYGGASALHACSLAQAMGLRRIIVPPSPGTFSALGVALAPAGRDAAATVLLPAAGSEGRRERIWKGLETRCALALAREGTPRSRIRFERSADLRFAGQSHELTVAGRGDLASAFRRAYRRLYGEDGAGRQAEIVTLRVRAAESGAPLPRPRPVEHDPRGRVPRPDGISPVVVGGRRMAVPWFRRDRLAPGTRIHGPARLIEYSATTFLAPGWTAVVDARANLLLDRASRKGRAR